MIIYVNGQFVEESAGHVAINDRGFQYGDGIFETVRAYGGRLFRFAEHWARLRAAAQYLRIELPIHEEQAGQIVDELLARNQYSDVIVRVQLTRGPGLRGYSIHGSGPPTLSIALHPIPPGLGSGSSPWRLAVARHRIPSFDPCGRFKTCNRLNYVLARMDAEGQGCDEALLLNEKDQVVEAASANVFWIESEVIHTPAPSTGLLPGITRAEVMSICRELNLPCLETEVGLSELAGADAIFLTQTVFEIVPVCELDRVKYGGHPLIDRLQAEFIRRIASATGR